MFINFSCSFIFSKPFLKLGRTSTKNYKATKMRWTKNKVKNATLEEISLHEKNFS
ncbi:unnamed protein product [Brassica oleracea]